MEGPDALKTIVEQLEGFEAPAGAWETEILPARLENYDPAWLDDHCLAGRIAWARLRPTSERLNGGERNTAPAPLRTTPITLLSRRHAPLWASLSSAVETGQPSLRAQRIADFIREHGASFFDELLDGTGLLRSQVEEALAELVAIGLVNSDSFGGLRALLVPSDQRRSPTRPGHRRGGVASSREQAGRWAPARRTRLRQTGPQSEADA